mmetsp:Transcript_35191/g.43028  ORF Transcript_35191/g.43028 Transcript_35191/m.43028 type:complete len:113 (+) Transcript_35191:473-811(+)
MDAIMRSSSHDDRDLMAPSANSFRFEGETGGELSVADSFVVSQYDRNNLHYLKNRDTTTGFMDQKLDKDIIDSKLVIENIDEMISAKLPIVQFMDSQEIIDEELLKDSSAEH